MESSDYKNKFKTLFDKLLQNEFELSAKHSEDLLKYLDGSQDKCVAKILETPFFANLLIYAIKNKEFASTSVKIFYSKLVRNVLSNEVFFNRFQEMQGFELLLDLGRTESAAADTPPELRLASAQQPLGLINHYSGVKHIVKSKIYQCALSSVSRHKSPGIAAVIYEFITKLVWKLNEFEEEEELLEVLKFIVKPILECSPPSPTTEAESVMVGSESLLQSLRALVHILGEVEHLSEPNNVVSMLSQVFSIESKLNRALEAAREPELARLLAEATLRYYYAASRQVAALRPDSATRVNKELYNAVNKITSTLIKKGPFSTLLEFLYQCHAFWYKVEQVGGQVTFEKFGKKFIFENYFILLILLPLFLKQKYGERLVRDPTMEDATEIFHSELAQKFPYDIVITAYDMRDLVTESTGNNVSLACAHSLRELLRLKRLLSRQQAGMVYQTLFYTLSEFVLSDGADLVLLANPLRTPDDVRFLALLLDAVAMLLDEHQLNWHDSLEIVELQAALVNLIKQDILPPELLVQALELLRRCVCKLLSPELALLMQPQRGGSLSEAAGAARRLLQRPHGGTRLASLHLILSFMEVAYVKFMPLRALISAHGLLCGAAQCATKDPDARAQAAALRCLMAAAGLEDLWTEMLAHCKNLYEQLVSILRHNPDGEVRKEAANVLTHVYINRRVNQAFTSRVSRAMARAATEDPYWPVQMAALNFWKQLMKTQCTDKGMIDGVFPAVTFSKEKRKIIVLNDKEIHKQLEIIMDNLSKTGCLAVLVKCMNSSNREVMEKAYKLNSRVVDALDLYKFRHDPRVTDSPSPTSPEATKNRSMKADIGTLIDELVAL
ncbi:uncharacterized protein LOC125233502 [Leguminivora glycinivorella]|uniref:uncharacterized protein LOC125233502 n=1 Tax=Leguminivora glycinivorella TaxID=1035111 RepID=UPI0020101AAC|nr:uncharacterized protein LOC125233502 [Leguminivora glycinivorella]